MGPKIIDLIDIELLRSPDAIREICKKAPYIPNGKSVFPLTAVYSNLHEVDQNFLIHYLMHAQSQNCAPKIFPKNSLAFGFEFDQENEEWLHKNYGDCGYFNLPAAFDEVNTDEARDQQFFCAEYENRSEFVHMSRIGKIYSANPLVERFLKRHRSNFPYLKIKSSIPA